MKKNIMILFKYTMEPHPRSYSQKTYGRCACLFMFLSVNLPVETLQINYCFYIEPFEVCF